VKRVTGLRIGTTRVGSNRPTYGRLTYSRPGVAKTSLVSLAASLLSIGWVSSGTVQAREQTLDVPLRQDASLGSLTCSPGDKVSPGERLTGDKLTGDEGAAPDASIGPAVRVICSFTSEYGIEEMYSGTLFRQDVSKQRAEDKQRGEDRELESKALVWIVRGPIELLAEPGFLSQTYTLRSTKAEGAIAPLVPKDGDDTSIALYGLKSDPRLANSQIITTLELKLEMAPA